MASTTTTTWLCKKKFWSLGKDLEKLCHPLSRLIRIQHLCGICWQPTTDSGSTLATTGSEGPVRATLCVWLWTTNWRNGIGRGKLDEWIMYSCDSIYPVNVATDLASFISCEYQIYYYYLQQNSLWTESEWVGGITRTNEMWHVRKSETIPVAVASIRGGSVKSGRTKSGHVFNILFNTPSSATVHDDDNIHCGAPADYSRPLSRTNRGGVVSVASRIIRQWLVREMVLELH